jgi:archaellin
MATTSALLTNNASSTLDASITNVATSLTLTAGGGAEFPNPGAGEYFYATLSNSAGSSIEIVKCTARATDVLTIVRGQDGTSGTAFNAGDIVELRPIAELFREKVDLAGINQAVNLWGKIIASPSVT